MEPVYKKKNDLLEGDQRRATKMARDFRNLKYRERLKFFGLTTLETKRIRRDLSETFRI